ncbi:hypothetical protein HJP15_06035 [Pseudoalteromonas sp. NEC-BIFX-2020_002]|nr:hypothetical protein [Pseudoalteromonas sp. NEC-BIFX-2020_002]NNG42483.1 hypothetical protein [Pseudoalteromonas sp. NEC-BIFX-2020_002]
MATIQSITLQQTPFRAKAALHCRSSFMAAIQSITLQQTPLRAKARPTL